MTDFRNGKVPVFTVWKWCGHTYLLGLGMDLVWTWGSEKKTQVSGIKILDVRSGSRGDNSYSRRYREAVVSQ